MNLNLSELWDYSQPALSEQRFRSAMEAASPEEALILHTQIARTYGLRGDFAQARQILAGLAPEIERAGGEAQVRYYLELGRSYASAAHPPATQTPEAIELARSAYQSALELAQTGELDHLAIDALHMMCFVDTAPAEQLAWNRQAIELLQASSQPEAKKWEGSLRNNLGYALHSLERYEEALQEFELALAARQRDGNPVQIRIAHWMVAWNLRAMDRLEAALQIQLRLEQEWDQAGEPDPYVFEELEALYRSLNQPERAAYYASRREASA